MKTFLFITNLILVSNALSLNIERDSSGDLYLTAKTCEEIKQEYNPKSSTNFLVISQNPYA